MVFSTMNLVIRFRRFCPILRANFFPSLRRQITQFPGRPLLGSTLRVTILFRILRCSTMPSRFKYFWFCLIGFIHDIFVIRFLSELLNFFLSSYFNNRKIFAARLGNCFIRTFINLFFLRIVWVNKLRNELLFCYCLFSPTESDWIEMSLCHFQIPKCLGLIVFQSCSKIQPRKKLFILPFSRKQNHSPQ